MDNEGCVVGIRWFSQMNDWMDCLVLVNQTNRGSAIAAVKSGVQEFWDSDCETYGDCIINELNAADIPYVIEYADPNIYSDEDAWEHHIQAYTAIGIPIIVV